MVQLICLAGDFVAEDVWWRVVIIVTNNPSVQGYAARKVLHALSSPHHVHETIVKVASQILGEFSDLLVKEGTTS